MAKKFLNKNLTPDDIQNILKNLDGKLDELVKKWETEQPKSGWMSFVFLNVVKLTKGVDFLIESLDHLIQYVEDLIPEGTDKKTAVLQLAGKLFDFVIAQNLPITLKFMSGPMKKIIVDMFLGYLIDFIVDKYNKGIWKAEATVF